MNLRNRLKNRINKKGFTLIELVVVLVIIAILAAIAVPVITGYIEDAREAEDYAKIGVLNRSSSAARAYIYTENPNQSDVFEGIDDDKKRQEKLIEYNLLDEVLVSRKGHYFYWNVDKQLWELKEGSGTSIPSFTDDGTIMDQSRGKDAPALDESKGSYKKGDLFTYNGEIYRLTGNTADKITGDLITPYLSNGVIKKIKLDYDSTNPYEYNDIIKHANGRYYKAVYNSDAGSSHYLTNGALTPDNLNKEYWIEVIQNSDKKWIDVE